MWLIRFKELLIMVDTCQAATLFSQVSALVFCFKIGFLALRIGIAPLLFVYDMLDWFEPSNLP